MRALLFICFSFLALSQSFAETYSLGRSQRGVFCYATKEALPVAMDFCRCLYDTKYQMVEVYNGNSLGEKTYSCAEVATMPSGKLVRLEADWALANEKVVDIIYCNAQVKPKNVDFCQKVKPVKTPGRD